MEKVTIYRETSSLDSHYRSLLYLQTRGQLELEFLDHKGLDWFLVKLWYRSALIRRLLTIVGTPAPRRQEPSWRDLVASLVHPLRLLRRETIVAAFAPYSMMVLVLLLLKSSGKKVIYYTSWPHWDTKRYVYRPRLGCRRLWQLLLSDLVAVGVTQKSTEGLTKQGAKARHIPHSVDTDLLVPPRTREGQGVTLLYVGRLVREKGLPELLGVFQSLRERYPQVRLTMVGDGPELGRIRNAKGVSCRGHIAREDDLVEEYQSGDIFVLNSFEVEGWQELFGISLVEAMACGLPCVATDCVGPRELVRDGMTGFIIPQKDEEALHCALERLILDEDLRAPLRISGETPCA